MRNWVKIFGIIAMVAVIGFSMMGCEQPTDGGSTLTGWVSISGTATVGGTLTAVTYALSGTGTISYQWKRNSSNGGTDSNIGTNSNMYVVQAEDIGSTITVTVTRSGYSGSFTSIPTATVILPALTGSVKITGTPDVGQNLGVDASALGGEGTITYQWKRGETVVGTGSTYGVQAEDIGSTITVTVRRSGNSGSMSSVQTDFVTDPDLESLGGTVVIDGIPQIRQTLTANTDSLGGSGTIAYQWKRLGTGGFTTNIGTNSSTYMVVAADIGFTITVTVIRIDRSGNLTSDPTATITDLPALSGTVVISGVAAVGQILTADISGLGGDGAITYQWKKRSTNIGTNSDTYTIIPADAGSTITVTVTRSENSGSVTSDPTATVSSLPLLAGTVTITGDAELGATLTADTSALVGSGTITYQWKRGGVTVGTSNTYEVQNDDVGYAITVIVTRAGYSGSVTSEPTDFITDPNLLPLDGTVSISGTATVGQTLTADISALGGEGTIRYQWRRGLTGIGENSDTYVVQITDVDSTITVTVTRSGNSGSVGSLATDVIPAPALSGTVSITGTAVVGQTLTAVTTSLDGEGTISYQWKRGETTIGTNSGTYTVQVADLGSTITVTVTRPIYTGSVNSSTPAAVTAPLTGTVTISGTAEVEQTLTADISALNGATTPTYQWKRGSTNVGTNSSTYTVQIADVGSTITVTVTRQYYTDSVSSPATAAVPVPELTGTVTISGTLKERQTLTAVTTALNGTGTLSYQWKRGATNVGTNSSTYIVQFADVGSTITVTVTRAGYSGSVTSPATAAVPTPILSEYLSVDIGTTGQGTYNDTLSLSLSFTGGGTGGYTYQWRRGSTNVSTGATYTMTTADKDQPITCIVSKSGYSGSVTTSGNSPYYVRY